jgi:hypothetical protein
MFNWIKRWFILPKANNSLSDILGSDLAKTVVQLAKDTILKAIVTALSKPSAVALNAETAITAEIIKVLGKNVPATIAGGIKEAVDNTARANLNKDVTIAAQNIADAIYKKIGLDRT